MRKCNIRVIQLVFLLHCVSISLVAQNDLLDLLNSKEEAITNYTIASFKGTRLVSGHSIETNGKGVLQFLIGHRFGRVSDGWRNLYGLDYATIRLGFEYGITDNLNIGLGRSSFQKTFDGTFKWKFLRQKYGASKFPVSCVFLSNIYILGNEWPYPDRDNLFSSRLSYHHSVLIARKFGRVLSLQLMPTIVHRNLVQTREDKNTIASMGIGGSFRLTGSTRFNVEYYYLLPNQIVSEIGGEDVKNSLSIGVDIETGGHVFQLHFTNSRGMTEKYLASETTGSWGSGDIHFGFNVSRVFTVRK